MIDSTRPHGHSSFSCGPSITLFRPVLRIIPVSFRLRRKLIYLIFLMHLAEVSAAKYAKYYFDAADPLGRLELILKIMNECSITLKHRHLIRQLRISEMILQPRVTLKMKLSMMRRGLKSL